MSFLTGIALRRRSVTVMMIILLFVGGVVVYGRLERELFPELLVAAGSVGLLPRHLKIIAVDGGWTTW